MHTFVVDMYRFLTKQFLLILVNIVSVHSTIFIHIIFSMTQQDIYTTCLKHKIAYFYSTDRTPLVVLLSIVMSYTSDHL